MAPTPNSLEFGMHLLRYPNADTGIPLVILVWPIVYPSLMMERGHIVSLAEIYLMDDALDPPLRICPINSSLERRRASVVQTIDCLGE